MEQSSLSNLIQGLTLELRNVACSVTNTLRGESLIKYIQPLICRENGGYKAWLEEMQKYFHVARVAEEDKCQAALLTTSGTVGQCVYRLLTNNPRLTWDDLKVSLEEYYGVVPNPNARLAELAKIRQGGTEGIQEYMQRVVRLAESAYAGIDGRNEVVSKQVLGFFIEGLREREIKKAVMKDKPQTLEAAYQKALSEWKWKIRLDEGSEYEDEPMEVCHSRRQLRIEPVGPVGSNNKKKKCQKKGTRGNTMGPRDKPPERGRNQVIRRWSCGREGHIQRFCRQRTPRNGRGPFVRRPANGAKW